METAFTGNNLLKQLIIRCLLTVNA